MTVCSKIRCEIFRNEKGAFIKDRSSNGTWVNGHKVGKVVVWPLEHNSELCFAGAKKKVFVFMFTSKPTESFPTELTNKFTVR